MSSPAKDSRRRLKISYLFSQFPLRTETFAVSDIAALLELGHQVSVHTVKPSRSDEIERERAASVPDRVRIYRPDLRRFRQWPGLLWRWRASSWRIFRVSLRGSRREPIAAIASLLCIPRILEICEEIFAEEADIAHLFWSRHASLVLQVLRESGGSPLRSAFVGAYDLVADDFLVQSALDSAQVIFSHANSNRVYIEDRVSTSTPIVIVHRGIPLMDLQHDTERDRDLWITASALVPSKNVSTVIETFARAFAKRRELRLIICGDGPERRRLERLSDDLGCGRAVHFAGHVDRRTLFNMMEKAGLFLLLSTKPSERLPNVVKEAMWCGCAIISSPTEGIEELIVDSAFGAIVDPGNAPALDAAVATARNEDEADAKKRRKRGREHIAKHFSSLGSMACYIDAWHEALLVTKNSTSSCSAE